MSKRLPPVLVITGPTASGKTGLGLVLAEQFNGHVINADSMQVYRDLRILTARPSEQEEARAPHRLYGVLDGEDTCSAGTWLRMAHSEIEKAHACGSLPIILGGTGLYIKALQEGLSPIPPVDGDIRHHVIKMMESTGLPGIRAELEIHDPKGLGRLQPADAQRHMRALEVALSSGKPLSYWQEKKPQAPAYRFARLTINPPRHELNAMIDSRFESMLEAGAIDEVQSLMAKSIPPYYPIMKAHGAPELMQYLRGEMTLAQAMEGAQQNTRRYAKRQQTWLRTQTSSHKTINFPLNEKYSERKWPEIYSFICEFLLTPEK